MPHGSGPRKECAIGCMDAAASRADSAQRRQEGVMQAPRISGSTFLPYTGEPIDFMHEQCNRPIHETFIESVTYSNWAEDGIDRVYSWHGHDMAPSIAPGKRPKTPRPGVLITTLKRLVGVRSERPHIAAPTPPRRHSPAPPNSAVAVQPATAPARFFDSNQISS